LSVYKSLGIPVLEWSTAMHERPIGETVVEAFLVQRIRNSPSSQFNIIYPEYPVEDLVVVNPSSAKKRVHDWDSSWLDYDSDLKEDGALGVELWTPERDIDGATVVLCIVHLSESDSVFGIGRCQHFEFPPETPPGVATYLAKANASRRAYGVWRSEDGSDKPEAIEAWRERMRQLGSSVF